ncbi:aromatic amino acid lyase [Kibdelosporangium aridum]|uniref:Aromatic amino acid lyase n=1 Tax=Kibdelosporangium aridum TaxID=2030 RepID=A0A428ZCE5_KIBAR|nr:aromatic amino acid ammonia-lyase [Kibdelosporangium aridum]RSM85754.1 aromatic amino acid lyase [Kibdelosporangium aridum]
MSALVLTGSQLTLEDVHAVAVEKRAVAVDGACLDRVRATHERVQTWGQERRPIYGVNTGFGELAHVVVPPEKRTELQVNLLRNHASGAGKRLDDAATRAVLLARVNCLVRGYSGASEDAVALLVEFLNRGIHPVIPQQGSLGASGDISPLCHMALPLIGESAVVVDGVERDAGEVLAEAGLKPLELGFKEGLALINGTSASAGTAALAMHRAERLLNQAVFLGSVFVQVLRGSSRAFDARGHELKGHPGQIAVASALRNLINGSALTREHVDLMNDITDRSGGLSGVQDVGLYIQSAYSLRCIPQILGPVLDTMAFCRRVIEQELNSSNDNPLFFDTAEETFHGGNFHGQYLAMASDYLGIAMGEIGVLAERQINRLVDPHLNGDLPDFLAWSDSGLSSGLSGTQYLATSIASENLDLMAPASVKSLASNAGNQDVVSMSLNSARKALTIADNVASILAVLGGCLFQASSWHGAENLSEDGRQWHQKLGKVLDIYEDAIPVQRVVNAVRSFSAEPDGVEFFARAVTL